MARSLKKRVRNFGILLLLVPLTVVGWVAPGPWGLAAIALMLIIISIEIPFIEKVLEKRISKNNKFGRMFHEYNTKMKKYFE